MNPHYHQYHHHYHHHPQPPKRTLDDVESANCINLEIRHHKKRRAHTSLPPVLTFPGVSQYTGYFHQATPPSPPTSTTTLLPFFIHSAPEDQPMLSPVSDVDVEDDVDSRELEGLNMSQDRDDLEMGGCVWEQPAPLPPLVEPGEKKKEGGGGRGERKESAAARFRMGFKPDCDKCLAKVPGHYSHF